MSAQALISAMAQVSSLGQSLTEFWNSLRDGRSGAGRLPQHFSTEPEFPVRFAHLLDDESLGLPAREKNLFVDENQILARHLLAQVAPRGRKVDAVIWGHGQLGYKFGNILFPQTEQILTSRLWRQKLMEILYTMNIAIPDEAAMINHSNACITGVTALAEAQRGIAGGKWQRVLVLVQEMRCRDWVLWPYYKLDLLDNTSDKPHTSMRPFSRDRAGFVKGEGGAAFLVESEEALKESGHSPYCRIAGAAYGGDGYKVFAPREDLKSAANCVRLALHAAGLEESDIDYINVYGSGSVKNDRMETRLIKEIFGARAAKIPLSTIKPQVGHLNTAAAAIEALATALMIRHQTVSPTLNLRTPDPECDLDFVALNSRRTPIRHALKLAFGFGWSNSALILSQP